MVVTHTVGWWQTHGFGVVMVVGGVVEFTIVVWQWSKFANTKWRATWQTLWW